MPPEALLDPNSVSGCGQVEEAFGKYDVDGSGGIELGEFGVMWEQMQLADYLGKVPQAPAQSAAAGSAAGGAADAVTAPREEAQYADTSAVTATADTVPAVPEVPEAPEVPEVPGVPAVGGGEMDEAEAAFHRFNANGDGMLDMDEVLAA